MGEMEQRVHSASLIHHYANHSSAMALETEDKRSNRIFDGRKKIYGAIVRPRLSSHACLSGPRGSNACLAFSSLLFSPSLHRILSFGPTMEHREPAAEQRRRSRKEKARAKELGTATHVDGDEEDGEAAPAGGVEEDKKRQPSTSSKRGSGSGGASPPCCQAEKCSADLTEAKRYYRRHKVCEVHSKDAVVIVAGLRQRFCQQCSRFHELSEFDDSKRSCRRRLAGHNERRRKSSSEAISSDARIQTSESGGHFQR